MSNATGNNGIKSDSLKMDIRIRSVMHWVLDGYVTKDIISFCMSKFDVDERMVYKYLREAKKLIKDVRKGKIDERVDFYIAAKMKLYNELKDKHTPKGAQVANSILDSMARVEGVILDRMDITSKDKALIPEQKVYKVTLDI